MWFHTIVQERLRYTPLGWSKNHEFNESDFKCAMDMIDAWTELVTRQIYEHDFFQPLDLTIKLNRFVQQECQEQIKRPRRVASGADAHGQLHLRRQSRQRIRPAADYHVRTQVLQCGERERWKRLDAGQEPSQT